MTQDWSDTGSIAGRFVDVDGVRRGCMDKAALGKSRRLMSSCMKQQYIYHVMSINVQ